MYHVSRGKKTNSNLNKTKSDVEKNKKNSELIAHTHQRRLATASRPNFKALKRVEP